MYKCTKSCICRTAFYPAWSAEQMNCNVWFMKSAALLRLCILYESVPKSLFRRSAFELVVDFRRVSDLTK